MCHKTCSYGDFIGKALHNAFEQLNSSLLLGLKWTQSRESNEKKYQKERDSKLESPFSEEMQHDC